MAASVAAACAIAVLVAGKAARDALFLIQFPATQLPYALMGGAALAIAASGASVAVLSRVGPLRGVSAQFGLSAIGFAAEWALWAAHPRAVAVVVYLHVAALGPLMVSGVWSIVSESFDPRTAKRVIGRIAAGGALGGVAGGLMAERAGSWFGVGSALPLLVGLSLAGLVAVRRLAPASRDATAPNPEPRRVPDVVRRTPHLLALAVMVLAITFSSNAVDYVLKAQAAAQHESSEGLLRFFALFHASVGVAAFVVHGSLSRRALEGWGLGATLACLPLSVLGGGAVLLAAPTLANVAALRGVEAVARGSLFKSAYEITFTPLPNDDKRAVKSLLDVGVERFADLASGALIRVGVVAIPALIETWLVVAAMALSSCALLLTRRVGRGYVQALEAGLVARRVELDRDQWLDRTTRLTLARVEGASPAAPSSEGGAGGAPSFDALLERLEHDEDALPAIRALRPLADAHVAELARALLDPERPLRLRRRIPRVLGVSRKRPAVEALVEGLFDARFDVRLQCGFALYRLAHRGTGVGIDRGRIQAAIEREVDRGRAVWLSERLDDDARAELPVEPEFLRRRADLALEHVFRLLTLLVAREPIIAAYHALASDDPKLVGTALEYLESALPDRIRERLWPHLEVGGPPPASLRSNRQLAQELVRFSETLRLNLESSDGD